MADLALSQFNAAATLPHPLGANMGYMAPPVFGGGCALPNAYTSCGNQGGVLLKPQPCNKPTMQYAPMQYAMGQYGPPQGYGAGPQMSLGGFYGHMGNMYGAGPGYGYMGQPQWGQPAMNGFQGYGGQPWGYSACGQPQPPCGPQGCPGGRCAN